MKTYHLILLAVAFLALAIIPSSYIAGQDDITIDKISFGSLVSGDDLTKEDLQDHVVGVKYMGKW